MKVNNIKNSIFNVQLKLEPQYQKLVKKLIHLLTICAVILFLNNSNNLYLLDLLIYIVLGELFYSMVVKLILNIIIVE